jgi:hypothetical protein
MRENFERDGFVIVPGALRTKELQRLEAAVNRVWETEAGSAGPFHRLAFAGLDDAFLELVDHPRCLPLVSDILGSNIYVYHCHLDVHPPERSAEQRWRWHQDGGRQNVGSSLPAAALGQGRDFLTDVPTAEHVRSGCSRQSLAGRWPATASPRARPGARRGGQCRDLRSPALARPRRQRLRPDAEGPLLRLHAPLDPATRRAQPRPGPARPPHAAAPQLLGFADDTSDYWFPAGTALRSRMPL